MTVGWEGLQAQEALLKASSGDMRAAVRAVVVAEVPGKAAHFTALQAPPFPHAADRGAWALRHTPMALRPEDGNVESLLRLGITEQRGAELRKAVCKGRGIELVFIDPLEACSKQVQHACLFSSRLISEAFPYKDVEQKVHFAEVCARLSFPSSPLSSGGILSLCLAFFLFKAVSRLKVDSCPMLR